MKCLKKLSYGLEELDNIVSSELDFFKQHKRLLLKGEVGAGKTTFIKTLGEKLGIEEPMDSPTYALINEYDAESAHFCHFDLYRIEDAEELFDLGWNDYLDSDDYLWVEWPERVPEAFDETFVLLDFDKNNKNGTSKITIWKFDER